MIKVGQIRVPNSVAAVISTLIVIGTSKIGRANVPKMSASKRGEKGIPFAAVRVLIRPRRPGKVHRVSDTGDDRISAPVDCYTPAAVIAIPAKERRERYLQGR